MTCFKRAWSPICQRATQLSSSSRSRPPEQQALGPLQEGGGQGLGPQVLLLQGVLGRSSAKASLSLSTRTTNTGTKGHTRVTEEQGWVPVLQPQQGLPMGRVPLLSRGLGKEVEGSRVPVARVQGAGGAPPAAALPPLGHGRRLSRGPPCWCSPCGCSSQGLKQVSGLSAAGYRVAKDCDVVWAGSRAAARAAGQARESATLWHSSMCPSLTTDRLSLTGVDHADLQSRGPRGCLLTWPQPASQMSGTCPPALWSIAHQVRACKLCMHALIIIGLPSFAGMAWHERGS